VTRRCQENYNYFRRG